MGILSACIRTQPLGTLWTGSLATSAGVPMAMAADSLLALLSWSAVSGQEIADADAGVRGGQRAHSRRGVEDLAPGVTPAEQR